MWQNLSVYLVQEYLLKSGVTVKSTQSTPKTIHDSLPGSSMVSVSVTLGELYNFIIPQNEGQMKVSGWTEITMVLILVGTLVGGV